MVPSKSGTMVVPRVKLFLCSFRFVHCCYHLNLPFSAYVQAQHSPKGFFSGLLLVLIMRGHYASTHYLKAGSYQPSKKTGVLPIRWPTHDFSELQCNHLTNLIIPDSMVTFVFPRKSFWIAFHEQLLQCHKNVTKNVTKNPKFPLPGPKSGPRLALETNLPSAI